MFSSLIGLVLDLLVAVTKIEASYLRLCAGFKYWIFLDFSGALQVLTCHVHLINKAAFECGGLNEKRNIRTNMGAGFRRQ